MERDETANSLVCALEICDTSKFLTQKVKISADHNEEFDHSE